jgi:hypothetical protein
VIVRYRIVPKLEYESFNTRAGYGLARPVFDPSYFTLWSPFQGFIVLRCSARQTSFSGVSRASVWGFVFGLCCMVETLKTVRRSCLALIALLALTGPGAAQPPQYPPYPGQNAGPGQSRSQVCMRLEAQLVSIDRGNQDPARAGQIRQLEDTANRLQSDLDRVTAQGRRMGCEGRGFFSLFGGGQPQQCGPVNNQIQQLRSNLDRVLSELERNQGNSADREGARRSVLAALGQNDCGPQYRGYVNRSSGGFFENLFGPGTIVPPQETSPSNTFRTVCVRMCDGYYFPISYSTIPGKFAEDEKTCQALCPAAEVMLYSHRNPGEDIQQAVSVGGGRPYTELPNAFAYRKTYSAACSCKGIGQTWADALKSLDDQTVERGDILVNEDQARRLSQPQGARPAAKNTKAAPKTSGKSAPTDTAASPPDDKPAEPDPTKRQVRTVGPSFFPVR